MSYKIDYRDGGYIARFEGDITIDEINLANGEVHGHENFDVHRYQVINLLEANLVAVTEDDVLIPAAINYVASKTRKNVKMAIVANQSYTVTLAKHFVSSAGDMSLPWQVKVFSELESALKWAKT